MNISENQQDLSSFRGTSTLKREMEGNQWGIVSSPHIMVLIEIFTDSLH